MYGDMFWAHFDLQLGHLCDLTSSLRGANDCLLFNANNLLHGSIGNYECKIFRCLPFAYRCLLTREKPNRMQTVA